MSAPPVKATHRRGAAVVQASVNTQSALLMRRIGTVSLT